MFSQARTTATSSIRRSTISTVPAKDHSFWVPVAKHLSERVVRGGEKVPKSTQGHYRNLSVSYNTVMELFGKPGYTWAPEGSFLAINGFPSDLNDKKRVFAKNMTWLVFEAMAKYLGHKAAKPLMAATTTAADSSPATPPSTATTASSPSGTNASVAAKAETSLAGWLEEYCLEVVRHASQHQLQGRPILVKGIWEDGPDITATKVPILCSPVRRRGKRMLRAYGDVRSPLETRILQECKRLGRHGHIQIVVYVGQLGEYDSS